MFIYSSDLCGSGFWSSYQGQEFSIIMLSLSDLGNTLIENLGLVSLSHLKLIGFIWKPQKINSIKFNYIIEVPYQSINWLSQLTIKLYTK